MSNNSLYPTIIIPDGLCDDLSELFQRKGWTYGEDTAVTPVMIENNIKQLASIIMEDPDENCCVSSGRIYLTRTRWGDTYDIDICVEFGEIEDIPYDNSPTKEIGDNE